MSDMLDQLKPIAEIIGPDGVAAEYSGRAIGTGLSGYSPGWIVSVDGMYKGAQLTFETRAPSIDEAAATALQQLKGALGLP